jgi:hypothetical protein
MGLVPKRLPSSEMGGLGEPRQLSTSSVCQGRGHSRDGSGTGVEFDSRVVLLNHCILCV